MEFTLNPSPAPACNCNVATCWSTLPEMGVESAGVPNISAVKEPTPTLATVMGFPLIGKVPDNVTDAETSDKAAIPKIMELLTPADELMLALMVKVLTEFAGTIQFKLLKVALLVTLFSAWVEPICVVPSYNFTLETLALVEIPLLVTAMLLTVYA